MNHSETCAYPKRAGNPCTCDAGPHPSILDHDAILAGLGEPCDVMALKVGDVFSDVRGSMRAYFIVVERNRTVWEPNGKPERTMYCVRLAGGWSGSQPGSGWIAPGEKSAAFVGKIDGMHRRLSWADYNIAAWREQFADRNTATWREAPALRS